MRMTRIAMTFLFYWSVHRATTIFVGITFRRLSTDEMMIVTFVVYFIFSIIFQCNKIESIRCLLQDTHRLDTVCSVVYCYWFIISDFEIFDVYIVHTRLSLCDDVPASELLPLLHVTHFPRIGFHVLSVYPCCCQMQLIQPKHRTLE